MDEAQAVLCRTFKRVFNSEDGRTVLAALRRWSMMDVPTVPAGQPLDPNWIIFYEAQRSLILRIEQQVEADFEAADEQAVTEQGTDEHA